MSHSFVICLQNRFYDVTADKDPRCRKSARKLRGRVKILAQLIRPHLRLEAMSSAIALSRRTNCNGSGQKMKENRKAKIAQFAKEHGFRLMYYKLGLGAMFVENSSSGEARTREKQPGDHLSQ